MKSPFKLSRRLPFGIIAPIIESFIGLKALDKLYNTCFPSDNPADFTKQALNVLDITYQIKQGETGSIPEKGPLIVMANHPFGGVEGLLLIDMMLKLRSDIKVLANQELSVFESLNKVCIDINVFEDANIKKKNWLAFQQAQQWIASGGALLLFPSGEVASWQWKHKKVVEAPWQKTVARLVKKTRANIIPVFFEGKNSTVFHSLGLIHKRARTFWLARELINKQSSEIFLRIGEMITPRDIAPLEDKTIITNYLRLNTLLLGCQQSRDKDNEMISQQHTLSSQEPVLSTPVNYETIIKEINLLKDNQLLLEKNEMQVWCAPSDDIPTLLNEIGRLREITFRAAGEGSGKSIDIDEFDSYYHHLFLWNTEKQEVAGAYRIGHVDKIMAEKGINGLYSQHLFGYDSKFLDKLSPCLEMGRSFIRQEYQKELNSLLFLWRGIGAYMARHPHYRVLFGPVTISNDYSETSRQLITSCLTVNNYDKTLAAMINPNHPYKINHNVPWTTEHLSGINQVELLSSLIKIIEGDKGIPILIKQYLKLQGEFVGFNLDKDFCNALDGLIIVDVTRVNRRTLNKYMGMEQAEKYLFYHEKTKDKNEVATA